MLGGRTQKRNGPEGLFAALAEPRLAFFEQSLTQAPLRGVIVFVLAMLGLSVFLVLAEIRAVDNGSTVDLLPSETVFPILMGMAVFPLRMILVPLGTYALCFALAFLLRWWLEPAYLPEGVPVPGFLLAAMALNAVPAVLAGLAGRLAIALCAHRLRYRDVALSLTMTLAYLLLGGGMVIAVTALLYDPAWIPGATGGLDAAGAGLFRVARIALCGAVLTLVMLDRPNRRNLTVAFAVLPAFLLLGVLRHNDIWLHPTLDVELLALAVVLLAPVYAAILTNVIGVIAYVAITGEFLVQFPISSPEVLRLELVSILLLALLYLLLLQRHQATMRARETRQTISRLMRVQSLANIGYFVLDTQTGEVRVDDVAAGILGTAPRFAIATILQRVPPADRAGIEVALAERMLTTRTLSFLLGEGPDWQEEGARKYLTVHAWYESRAGGRVLAYGAVIDLTADHAREEALGQALSRLSDQQDRQTRMFSIVSHELRTPASVISMLIEELEGGAKWAEMGPRLRAVSEQLLSVLADMRQAVRPQENLPVTLTSFLPKDLAETVRNTFLLMAEAKGIEIDLNLSPEAALPRRSDRVRLMQALSNLVKNAILHSGCQRITLSYAEEDGAEQRFGLWQIGDDGQGVPPALRADLFSPFRRGEGPRSTQVDGSGLGLYVTKSSIELLGGTVGHQPGPAGGSVFVLRLPMLAAEPVALPGPAAEPAAARPARDWRSHRVLLVEDSDLIGELLVARLKRVFGAVDWARTGIEALARYEAQRPDVVLTDLFMPEMGGDDLTAALRAKGADCPIIGMTAAAIGDERTRFEEAGTDRVLTKPVSTGQFLDVLDELDRQRDRPAAE